MYVLLGSNGHISAKAARLLLSQEQEVRVVGRSTQSLAPLTQLGAEPAVGDIADKAFLTAALRGAHAVFAMIPPNYASPTPLADAARIGEAITVALVAAGVRRVVNLSSTGAHLAAGTGPIAGLHAQEARLNWLAEADVLHLRPGYFYENHFNAIGVIKTRGVYADTLDPQVALPAIATADIAAVVVRELRNPPARPGKRVLHLRGPVLYTPGAAAAILGQAIGKPDLEYVLADAAQVKAGMVEHGVSPAMADLLLEMSQTFRRAEFMAELIAGPTEVTGTRLEDFAPAFLAAYEGRAGA